MSLCSVEKRWLLRSAGEEPSRDTQVANMREVVGMVGTTTLIAEVDDPDLVLRRIVVINDSSWSLLPPITPESISMLCFSLHAVRLCTRCSSYHALDRYLMLEYVRSGTCFKPTLQLPRVRSRWIIERGGRYIRVMQSLALIRGSFFRLSTSFFPSTRVTARRFETTYTRRPLWHPSTQALNDITQPY